MGGTARSAQAVRARPRTLPDKGLAGSAEAFAPVCARQPSALSAQGTKPAVVGIVRLIPNPLMRDSLGIPEAANM